MKIEVNAKDKNMVIFLIVVSWVWVIISFVSTKLSFQDSGSIVVLFCVLNEFYMRRNQNEKNAFSKTVVAINTYSIALGTLIWGYGKTLETESFLVAFAQVSILTIVLLPFLIKFFIKISDDS